ncbi:YczE/YyaS/YitT family protein [Streptococcus pluranimalium]
MIKKTILSFLFYMMSALGISLTIKADIGVSSFNSLNVAVAELFDIKIGTVTGIINGLFLITSYFLDKRKSFRDYTLMVFSVLFLGYAINFFVYDIFIDLLFSNYIMKIVVFIMGTCIAGFGTGRIIHFGILIFPIEKFCQLMSSLTSREFSSYRYGIDIICVTLSVLISIVFHQPIVVREGTIISLVLLSYIIGRSK